MTNHKNNANNNTRTLSEEEVIKIIRANKDVAKHLIAEDERKVQEPVEVPNTIPSVTTPVQVVKEISGADTMRIVLRERGTIEVVPELVIPAPKATVDAPVEKDNRREGIEEVAKNVQTSDNIDAGLIGLAAGISGAALSAGYDFFFGDADKSGADIALHAAIDGVVAGGVAYAGAKIFEAEDCSMLGITALGLTAGAAVVGADKAIRSLFSGDAESHSQADDSLAASLA